MTDRIVVLTDAEIEDLRGALSPAFRRDGQILLKLAGAPTTEEAAELIHRGMYPASTGGRGYPESLDRVRKGLAALFPTEGGEDA